MTIVRAWCVGTANQWDGTVLASILCITITNVVISSIHACTMFAGIILQTFIDVSFAVRSFKTRFTLARVIANPVDTVSVPARVAVTFVDVYLTVLTHRAGNTHAVIPISVLIRKWLREYWRQFYVVQIVQRGVRPLETLSRVLARIRIAFINVDLAIFALKPRIAVALIVVDLVDTLGTVLAGIRFTLVDVLVTGCTRIAGLVAITQEPSQLILTATTMLARVGLEMKKESIMMRR